MNYAARYREAIEVFCSPLTSGDGTPAEEIRKGETQLGFSLPEAVRAYYRTLGRHRLNQAHNRLFSPEEWFVHEGRLVFMEENQAVLYWGVATDEGGADPVVYQGANLRDEAIEWHSENACCADFMLVMMHWQAVCGGLEFMGMAHITPADLEQVRAQWSSIGALGGGLRAFTQHGDVACVIGQESDLEIFAASRTENGYERLDRRLTRLGIMLNQI